MRLNRISFLGGLAIGYVLGAQAGRERYEQLKQLARKAAESPAMQQTAGALQAQAQATASPYEVGDEHLKAWVEFLRHCGGFEVM